MKLGNNLKLVLKLKVLKLTYVYLINFKYITFHITIIYIILTIENVDDRESEIVAGILSLSKVDPCIAIIQS